MFRLSTVEQAQLQKASEVMLRPFEHAELSSYLRSCAGAVKPLLNCFGAVSGYAAPDGTVHVVSDDYTDESVRQFAGWKLRDAGTERTLARGMEVMTMRGIVDSEWDALEQDPMMNEWYYPHGVADAAGMLVHWPEDGALSTIEFHHARFGTTRMGEEAEWILRLLLPSFRGGCRLLYTLGQHRNRLARDLDQLGVHLCVCSREGRIEHVSGSAREMLARDPEERQVLARVAAVAGQVASGLHRPSSARNGEPARAHEVVATHAATYRLSGAIATHELAFGSADILVVIARLTPEPLSVDGLVARFGLTPREADVALRLALGERNDTIATALRLSPHTVRRHTERVLDKLGVATRAEAAAKLRV